MTFDEMLDKKIEAKVELILRKRFKQLLCEAVVYQPIQGSFVKMFQNLLTNNR